MLTSIRDAHRSGMPRVVPENSATRRMIDRRPIRPKDLMSLTLALLAASLPAADAGSGLVRCEFLFDDAPFASCHASTIAEAAPGEFVAAWFGGTEEGADDVGIWVSRSGANGRCGPGGWTVPVEVADGVQHRRPDGAVHRHPAWNPVLFQPADGPLMLFYKVGPSPQTWWGELTTSDDGGRTWGRPRRLPEGILGPIKNKPVELPGGDLLCPVSAESTDKPSRWTVHFERTADLGKTWTRTAAVNDGVTIGAIQPSLLSLGGDHLLAVGRTRQNRLFEVASEDGGRTWGPLTLGTLPNPNSGVDAVTLRDGRHLIVYNHAVGAPGRWGGTRTPLNVAVSDDGRDWRLALVLEDEPGEFSYPAVIQSADGLVHVTYTWNRTSIHHCVIDPAGLTAGG